MKRFFDLDENQLSYFKGNQKEFKKGCIVINQSTDIRINHHRNKKFSFEISQPNRTYLLCALSEAEMKKWIKVLNKTKLIYIKKNQNQN